ncbi:uncharacterized protein LOC122087975 [Macadamia integrifolia]|uniref:uncharacterized protein LOC122087975 n=1 Tax=Macadamia integrifolia TaxID=60698 RepID=UPI001C502158|nr:uncharacterized protein LOC122087975 [Macadamia integrifolia]
MNTVKGSWVGKTFALAKCNDSGGRKSRIRRSKEERKDMVESFIQRYQKANNGSFPSLNLTHKEVGGSFYTVREIVREIIQENRVLGPSKLVSEEIDTEQVSEHYPLGSISIEPESPLSISSSGSCLVSNDHQSIHKDLVSTSIGHSTVYIRRTSDNENYIDSMLMRGESEESNTGKSLEHGSVEEQVNDKAVLSMVQVSETSSGQSAGHNNQTFNNGMYTNGSHMDEHEDSNARKPLEQGSVEEQVDDKAVLSVVQVSENSSGQSDGHNNQTSNNGMYISGSYMNEHEDINAGKPLEQGSVTTHVDNKPIFSKDQVCEKLDGVENVKAPIARLNPIAVDVIVETFPLKSAGRPILGADSMSGEARGVTKTLNEQESKKGEATGNTDLQIDGIDSLEGICHGLVDEKTSVNIAETFSENLSCFATQNSTRSTLLESIQTSVEVSQNDVSTLKTAEPNNTVSGIEPKLVPADVHSSSTSEESLSQEAISKAKADIEHRQSTGEGSNTTLNRFNLESREGASKKSVKAEINPLWTVFTAFISSFVKFWSQ